MNGPRVPDSIPAPPALPPRTSPQPYPPRRFVPGRHPHPGRAPGGSVQPALPPDEAARHGSDLFDARYFWEAHEAWEPLWRHAASDRDRAAAQGLILLAAALLKLHVGNSAACRRLATRALTLLDGAAAAAPGWHGVDLARSAEIARARLLLVERPTLEEAAFTLPRR